MVCAFSTEAQKPLRYKYTETGSFSVGIRSALSMVNSGEGWYTGIGLGLQCRIMPAPHINTEWFFETLEGGYTDLAVRTEWHIGGLALFYPQRKLQRVAPFLA